MKKTAKPTACHDCLENFATKSELYVVPIVSNSGPEYSIFACAACTKKRGHDAKKLETAKDYTKRLNQYLGLKS